MQTDCPVSIQACALRVTRLDPITRRPVDGSDAAYITNAFTEFRFSPETDPGTLIETRTSCGDLRRYRDPETVKGLSVALITEGPDPELHELLVGASLIASAGATIGMNGQRFGAVPNHVSLEVWSKAVVGGRQASVLPWLHWAFPDVVVQIGERLLDNGQALQPFTGFAIENPLWGQGAFNDWPPGGTPLLSAWGVTRSATLPTSTCGYVSVTNASGLDGGVVPAAYIRTVDAGAPTTTTFATKYDGGSP